MTEILHFTFTSRPIESEVPYIFLSEWSEANEVEYFSLSLLNKEGSCGAFGVRLNSYRWLTIVSICSPGRRTLSERQRVEEFSLLRNEKRHQWCLLSGALSPAARFASANKCSPGRIRTYDQLINSQLLYRLSYRGV